MRRLAQTMGAICRFALLAATIAVPAGAAPVIYDFSGVVDDVFGESGTAVGNAISGSFTYDPVNYTFGNVVFTARTGSFELTEDAYLAFEDNIPGDHLVSDSLFVAAIVEQPMLQYGIALIDPSNEALTGIGVAYANWDLSAYSIREVRWLNFNPNGIGVHTGWQGTLTSLSPAPVPEPATLGLLGLGVLGMACGRRKTTGHPATKRQEPVPA